MKASPTGDGTSNPLILKGYTIFKVVHDACRLPNMFVGGASILSRPDSPNPSPHPPESNLSLTNSNDPCDTKYDVTRILLWWHHVAFFYKPHSYVQQKRSAARILQVTKQDTSNSCLKRQRREPQTSARDQQQTPSMSLPSRALCCSPPRARPASVSTAKPLATPRHRSQGIANRTKESAMLPSSTCRRGLSWSLIRCTYIVRWAALSKSPRVRGWDPLPQVVALICEWPLPSPTFPWQRARCFPRLLAPLTTYALGPTRHYFLRSAALRGLERWLRRRWSGEECYG